MFEEQEKPVQRRTARETLLLALSAILAVAVTPFAYIRLRDEQWSLALLDMVIVCVMLVLFVIVAFSRRTRTAGIVMALGFITAALMTTLLLGVSQVFWAYPALTAAFFMLETRQASILSGGFCCCFAAILWGEIPLVDLATISLTLITTILFAHAFAITDRRQQSRLRHLANVDPLTGAGNRRAQNEKLDTVNAIFRRNGVPSSVLIMDVDFFKKVNDIHGHVTGDQVLVDIADLVRSHTRATETLYRYGGEEFVIVAEHTNRQAAAQLAEKIRQLIEDWNFTARIKLTVSIGVAELHRGEGRQGWLHRADAALYQAKKSGRNRVVLAEAPVTTLFCVESPGAAKPAR